MRLSAALQRGTLLGNANARLRVSKRLRGARSPPNENGNLLERLKESLRREDVKTPPRLGFTRGLTGG